MHYKADRVEIRQPDPRIIEIIASLEDGRSKRRSLNREDDGFSCTGRFVVISTSTDFDSPSAAPMAIASWSWKKLRLARVIDGSLAVESVAKDFGVINFVLPIGSADSSWFYFPKVSEAPARQSTSTP